MLIKARATNTLPLSCNGNRKKENIEKSEIHSAYFLKASLNIGNLFVIETF